VLLHIKQPTIHTIATITGNTYYNEMIRNNTPDNAPDGASTSPNERACAATSALLNGNRQQVKKMPCSFDGHASGGFTLGLGLFGWKIQKWC